MGEGLMQMRLEMLHSYSQEQVYGLEKKLAYLTADP